MSSVNSPAAGSRWGYYTILGEGGFKPSKTKTPEIDPMLFLMSEKACPGVEMLTEGFGLDPGYWRIRVVNGQALGSGALELVDPENQARYPLSRTQGPEIQKLAGDMVMVRLETQAQLNIVLEAWDEEFCLLYPLTLYLEHLT
jgi:hypothetical protein